MSKRIRGRKARKGQRTKRRNGDDDIRRLERIAFTTQDPSDIAAYWKACLRAKIEPKPTSIETIPQGITTPEPIVFSVWTLHPKSYRWTSFSKRGRPPRITQSIKQRPYVHGPIFEVYNYGIDGNSMENHFAQGDKKEIFEVFIERFENGQDALWVDATKENPDDDLRRLERASNNSDSDLLAYWKACLRAGELPKPNKVSAWSHARVRKTSKSKKNYPKYWQLKYTKEYQIGDDFWNQDRYITFAIFSPGMTRWGPSHFENVWRVGIAHYDRDPGLSEYEFSLIQAIDEDHAKELILQLMKDALRVNLGV